MGIVVRRNERSWAIVIISEIRVMLNNLNLKIKSAGGESTLSVNKKSMFPDVLLYEDEAQTKILQGWELKMPDVLITDDELIADAARKANALGLNSFVIWNFSYGKLYVKNETGNFEEKKAWSGTSHITSRDDVTTYKAEWMPVVKEIVLTVNQYLVSGEIMAAPLTAAISENIMTEVIQRNKNVVAEYLCVEAGKNMQMERRLNVWWKSFHEEYDRDENNLYLAYAKNILLNWTNRIAFANTIKRYHNCAYLIKNIDDSTNPEAGNIIIDEIIKKGDYFNVLNRTEFNEYIPEDTWIDIVDFNQFLIENNIERIALSNLQDILEKTVNVAKREIRGQYATPYKLADILCQITIDNWSADCADFCAGTGTIAKAILNNKKQRVRNRIKEYETTWISDKYAYPLQIANIALSSIESVNIPIKSFTSDAFDIKTGQKVIMRSPQDGTEFEVQIPPMHAIVSNLPFVKYNNNPAETKEFMKKYQAMIFEGTGIKFAEGKTDIYNYLPFKLYELLEKDGKLGIIISNSWLGSETGYQFFKALQYYYVIKSVVISGKGKWFDNADVITTMLVLQKKDIRQPECTEKISFFQILKNVNELTKSEIDSFIDSIVLREVQDKEIISSWQYSIAQIDKLVSMGISLNALFHNVEWISKLEPNLIPITDVVSMVRGERTGHNKMFYIKGDSSISKKYLVPMLKTSQSIKELNAKADMQAFCCYKTIEELKAENDEGTLKWIRKFSDENYNPIPTSINYSPWYQMPSSNKADLVLSENPDKRLFIAKLEESVLVDQRLIAMKYKNQKFEKELVFALLNSLYGMFAIEANGFGRGQGVLDISKTRFQNVYMINPEAISKGAAEDIIAKFSLITKRDIKNIDEELKCKDRIEFEKKVLEAIGCGKLYEKIRKSIFSMQNTRHAL